MPGIRIKKTGSDSPNGVRKPNCQGSNAVAAVASAVEPTSIVRKKLIIARPGAFMPGVYSPLTAFRQTASMRPVKYPTLKPA